MLKVVKKWVPNHTRVLKHFVWLKYEFSTNNTALGFLWFFFLYEMCLFISTSAKINDSKDGYYSIGYLHFNLPQCVLKIKAVFMDSKRLKEIPFPVHKHILCSCMFIKCC